MFLPISTDNPLRSTPYMNWFLIALNVAAYFALSASPPLDHFLTLYPASPHWYSFFTYQFDHAGALHIAGNMLFLFIFGNTVNDKMGQIGYLAFYLAGGVFAGTCYVFTEQNGIPMVGASGGDRSRHRRLSGPGAAIKRHDLLHVSLHRKDRDPEPLGDRVLLRAGSDAETAAATVWRISPTSVGRFLGFTVCLIFLMTHLLPRDQFDVWALITRWNKRRQYRDLVAQGFDPFDYTTPARGGVKRVENDTNIEQARELRERVNAALSMREMAVAASAYVQMKALDPDQVMSKQAQLDIATQLHHDGRFA